NAQLVIALYRGSSCGNVTYDSYHYQGWNLATMGYAYDCLTPGETVWMRIYDYNNQTPGPFTVCAYDLTPTSTLSNDAVCGATTLTVNSTCINTSGNLANATNSCGAADPAYYSGQDLWYKAVVPSTGHLAVEAYSTDVNAQLVIALYRGSSCGNVTYDSYHYQGWNLATMGYAYDCLDACETVWMRIYDYNNQTPGSFTICAYDPTPGTSPCTGPVPVANFVASATNISTGTSINFTDLSTNTPTSWSWSFTGGSPTSSTSQNPTNIAYNTAGCYEVTLTSTNTNGSDSETKTCYIDVTASGSPPVAQFFASQTSVTTGTSINFTDQSTNSPTAWSWSFTGASPNSSTDQNPSNITYNTIGCFEVTLTATNTFGSDVETITCYIDVSSGAPSAEFGASSTSILEGGSVNFNDFSTNGPTSWLWTFTGGVPSSSTAQNPSGITYSAVGCYQVELTSTNTFGSDNETKICYINVLNAGGGGSVCDTISNFSTGDTPTLGGSSGWGYISGHNFYNDIAKGDYFAGITGYTLDAVELWFGKAHSGSGSSTINVVVWDGASGTPGAILASETLSITSLALYPTKEVVNFSTPPDISNNYFLGIQFNPNGTPQDTVALMHNANGESVPATAWEQWSTNAWYRFDDTLSWGNNQSLGIWAVRCTPGSSCPTITISSTTNDPSCAGNDGSATASSSGGAGPYTYQWSSGATTATASNLSAGTYNVFVIDNNGCAANTSVTLNPASGGPSVTTTSTAPSCGNSDGTATADATGGATPYTYLWSNSQTTQTAIGLAAGSYTVTVTDNGGCSATASLTLISTGGPNVTTTSVDPSCGTADGMASANATGGATPYTYLWSNGQSGAITTGLSSGSYTVTVTDNNGCTGTSTVTLSSSNSPIATTTGINLSCSGDNNGSATASGSGGTTPYTYSWDNGGNTATITGLAAGTYCVTVSDANGCSGTTCQVITEPASMTVSYATSDPSCGNNDGSVTASAFNGSSPYSYQWDASASNQSTSTATGLAAGSYTVTVTDASGCTYISTANLSNAGAGTPSIIATDPTCFGGNNGAASVSITGGTSPYTYAWSTGDNSSIITDLAAGIYTVTITDASGCIAIEQVDIIGPPEMQINSSVGNDLGSCDGSAAVTVSNGQTPYTYQWDIAAGGQTTPIATDLCTGSYTVTVTDASGCTITTTVNVGFGSGIIERNDPIIIVVYPNPNRGLFTLEINVENPHIVQVLVLNVLGQTVYYKELGRIVGTYRESLNLEGFGRGMYHLQVSTEKEIIHKNVVIE
ncbi:MAG: hypothetical protein COB85_00615, partial [Bacteroidetes bacterium]